MSNQQVIYQLSLRDQLTAGLNNADNAAKRLEGTMGNLQSILGALGVAGGIAGLVAFGRSVVDAGTKVQDATTGLTTLLKDAKGAATVISNTMEDAVKAPFGFESLLMANKALISTGLSADQSRKDVMNLANAIAATGGGDAELQRMVVNMQQIANTGEATAVDIKQFAYAGINIYKLLEDAGIKLAKGQQATYQQITMALQKAHDEGGLYFNGLENMANNTSVKISNLGDAFFQLQVKIFNGISPAFNSVITGLTDMVEWAKENTNLIKNLAIVVGTAATAYGLYNVALKAQVMWQGISTGTTKLGVYWQIAMGNAMVVSTQKTGLLAAAQLALNNIMRANPIGLVITGLAVLTAAIVVAYEKSAVFRAGLWGLWGGIKAVGESIKMYFVGLKDVLVGTFTLDPGQIEKGLSGMASAVFGAGGRIAKGAQEGYAAGMADFAKDQQAKKEAEAQGGTPTPSAGLASAGANGANPTPSKGKSVAQGTKVTTINVSIKDLIGEYNLNVTNVREGSEKVKQMVVDALTGAVNDFQLIVQ